MEDSDLGLKEKNQENPISPVQPVLVDVDLSILACRKAQSESGMTLVEIGEAMGYSKDMARKSAWQFLNKTTDPRISMIRRFAAAVGVSVESLIVDQQSVKVKSAKD